MSIVLVIILAIVAFGVLIAVHEAGHFFAAKAFGVQVNEFSLGMGPVLLKKQGKETLYSLRLLPFGGFCAMEGENGEESEGAPEAAPAEINPRAFYSKPAWQRAIILCAGAFMNFVLGLLLILCIVPYANLNEPIIVDFMEGCPYESAQGFQAGDRVYSVDGHRTYFVNDLTEYLSRGNESHRIVLIREGKRVVLENFRLTLREYTQADGSTVMKYGLYFAPREFGAGANLKYAWFESLDFVRLVWRSLGDLVTGRVGVRELSGPVGVVDYVGETVSQATSPLEAWFSFFYIFALIAVNLAVMNLLPIPALDGGRVFFLLLTWLIEAITRRKLNPKYEAYIHTAGFVLLMGLMVFVLLNDVIKIFVGR